MGRNISTGTTGTTGTITEASAPIVGTIAADGAVILQSAQPALFAIAGKQDLQYDLDQLYNNPTAAGGPWNSTASQNGYYADFQTDGTQFVFTNGSYIFASPDAVKWKPVCIVPQGLNAATQGVISKIKYRSGIWFAYSLYSVNYGYLTSTDGVTWSVVNTPMTFADMTWDGTNFMFVNTTSSYYGTTVANADANKVALAGSCVCVEKIGTNFVAWANSTTTNCYITSTGASWALQATTMTLGRSYSIANGNLFIARFVDATSRPLYVASPDGTTWTASGTSFGAATESTSPTCVVWDGTRYSIGIHSTTANNGRIFTFTTLGGAATGYQSATDSTNQCQYCGHLICYKSGTYAYVGDYGGGTMYVGTVSPTVAWGVRASFAAGTAYPFFPLHAYSALGMKDAPTTRGGIVTTHNYLVGATNTYITCPFLDDTTGYYVPYKTGADYWSISVNPASGYLNMGISNDGSSLLIVWVNFRMLTVNHTTRTCTVATVSAIAGNHYAIVPFKSAFVIFGGITNEGTINSIKFDATIVTNNSMPGMTVSPNATYYSTSFNPNNGCAMAATFDATTYYVNTSWDGQTWVQEPVPLIFNADGTAGAVLTSNYVIWHSGKEFMLVTGGVVYRGTSTRRLVKDTGLLMDSNIGAIGTCVSVIDANRIFGTNSANTKAALYDLRYGNRNIQRGNSTVSQGVAYEYAFGTVLSLSSFAVTPATQMVINLLRTPASTYFKVPKVPASVSNGNKTTYIAT